MSEKFLSETINPKQTNKQTNGQITVNVGLCKFCMGDLKMNGEQLSSIIPRLYIQIALFYIFC